MKDGSTVRKRCSTEINSGEAADCADAKNGSEAAKIVTKSAARLFTATPRTKKPQISWFPQRTYASKRRASLPWASPGFTIAEHSRYLSLTPRGWLPLRAKSRRLLVC